MNRREERIRNLDTLYDTTEVRYPIEFGYIRNRTGEKEAMRIRSTHQPLIRILGEFRSGLETSTGGDVQKVKHVTVDTGLNVRHAGKHYKTVAMPHIMYLSSHGRSLILYASFDLPEYDHEAIEDIVNINTDPSMYMSGAAQIIDDHYGNNSKLEQAVFVFQGALDRLYHPARR